MRATKTFLTDWLFCFDAKTEDSADFLPVTLPYAWNNLDGQDGRQRLQTRCRALQKELHRKSVF